MHWDIFCRVIDNHGDAGVCWRLCAELAARGQQVRLWIDDPAPLSWMAPQGAPGVDVVPWNGTAPPHAPGDVVVEAFGCDPHEGFLEAMAARVRGGARPPAWFNLEYLSAESWVERCHGLPSPVLGGPARGLTKRFFYPGFTAATGGLILEHDYEARRAAFDAKAWRRRLLLPERDERLVSLFCYEPPALPAWLATLGADPTPTRLLVTEGRARRAVQAALSVLCAQGEVPLPAITWLPLMPQTHFDELLWACDLNFVRGEDSLVRALWSRKPFVWQIYPQDDAAHGPKLQAFLDWLQAPPSLRAFTMAWNCLALPGEPPSHAGPVPVDMAQPLPATDLASWASCVERAADRLRHGPQLVSALLEAAHNGNPNTGT